MMIEQIIFIKKTTLLQVAILYRENFTNPIPILGIRKKKSHHHYSDKFSRGLIFAREKKIAFRERLIFENHKLFVNTEYFISDTIIIILQQFSF